MREWGRPHEYGREYNHLYLTISTRFRFSIRRIYGVYVDIRVLLGLEVQKVHSEEHVTYALLDVLSSVA